MATAAAAAEMPRRDYSSIAFSCVVDRPPSLIAQCFVWVNCLIEIQRIPVENIFVHHAAVENTAFLDWLHSLHVNVVEVEPFDSRSPHCNKIRQLKTFVGQHRFSHVVLMDCDVAWVGDQALPLKGQVAGKIVDLARPWEVEVAKIFREAGVGKPHWVKVTFPEQEGLRRTDHNNCNGGLYIVAAPLIPKLDAAWTRWAKWCLDRLALFGESAVHADQVSFALALRGMGVRATHLPMEWNFPLHLPAAWLPDVVPQMLHFHRALGPHFLLPSIGHGKADPAIVDLNERIRGFLKGRFLNSVFWDYRYNTSPELGSGLGSRGEVLVYKQKLLGHVLTEFADKRVLDVGCGDIEVAGALPFANYTGVDVSQEALRIAKAKRPDWQFRHLPQGEGAFGEAEAVICLDVLIHQGQRSEFDGLLRRLADAATERLIVSGFNEPPAVASEITAFHTPIVEALRALGCFGEISVVGKYRDTSMVVADKRSAGALVRHPHDMPAADFNLASGLTQRPDLLRLLADLSRPVFGFYTKDFARAAAYPWMAQKLESIAAGAHALDIGAGLNPLPLFLARQGTFVDSVDPHPLQRIPPATSDWDDIGFYDYRRQHSNLCSYNTEILDFTPAGPLAAIYSVNAVGHMSGANREALLTRCRQWLVPQGRLLLTIELIQGTQLLRDESDRHGEPAGVQSDIGAFAAQLGAAGFDPVDAFVWQNVPQSRIDLFFVECVAR